MKLTFMKHRIGGAILGLLLMLGIGMIASTTAQAQWPWPGQDQYRRDRDRRERDQDRYRRDRDRDRDDWWDQDRDDRDGRWNRNRRGRGWDGYRNYGGSYELRQTALNAGYNEGRKAGINDRRHNNRYDFRDEGAYRKANRDYNSRLGDRWIYERYFRDAFENGYADGYDGY